MNLLDVLAALLVAAPLAMAGVAKFLDPDSFREGLRLYRSLPTWAHRPLQFGLPALEVATAAGVVVLPITATAMLAAGLYFAFAVLLAVTWASGIRGDCGCFGPVASSIGIAAVVRSALLGAVSGALAVGRMDQPLDLDPSRVVLATILLVAGAAVVVSLRSLRQ